MDEFVETYEEFQSYLGSDLVEAMSAPKTVDDLLYRLVLGFIWANPSMTETDEDRASTALSALLGRTVRARPYTDESALLAMAERHAEDLQCKTRDPAHRVRSARELANELASRMRGQHSVDATADRLRRKFAEQRSELVATVGVAAVEVEVLKRQVLDDLETRLARFGISYWGDS